MLFEEFRVEESMVGGKLKVGAIEAVAIQEVVAQI
jgi:hypothetical protein